MRRTLSAAAALAVLLMAGAGPALAAFDDLQKAFDSFYKTGLDPAGGVAIENLTLQKDAMTLVLKKGILIPMQPIEGEITGAVFVGEGTASLTTPTPMDVWYLRKTYGSDKFYETFTNLYMRFTDGTEKSFPKPAPGTTQAAVASRMEEIEKTFKDRQALANGWEVQEFDMDLDFLDSRIGGIRG